MITIMIANWRFSRFFLLFVFIIWPSIMWGRRLLSPFVYSCDYVIMNSLFSVACNRLGSIFCYVIVHHWALFFSVLNDQSSVILKQFSNAYR